MLLERVFGDGAQQLRQRRVERRIDTCGLRVRKTLEAFDWLFQKNLNRAVIEGLATLGFIDDCEDLLITGKSGTGKSHILQALALRACEREIQVRYTRCVDLIDDLYAGLADQTYEARLRRWARAEWLVIDDVGLGQLRRRDDEPTAAHMPFNLLDRRHEQAATAIQVDAFAHAAREAIVELRYPSNRAERRTYDRIYTLVMKVADEARAALLHGGALVAALSAHMEARGAPGDTDPPTPRT